MFAGIVEIDHKDRDQMLSRRQARRFALQVLFSFEFLHEDIHEIISRVSDMLSHEVDEFSLEIIQKTHDHLEELDKHILNSLKDELFKWQKVTSDPLVDTTKARRLFDMIVKTGIDTKNKKLVPYLEMMDPKLKFDK